MARLIGRTPAGGSVDGQNLWPAISTDGRRVAWTSEADDLVPGDPNGTKNDVFRHDLRSGRTLQVSDNPPENFDAELPTRPVSPPAASSPSSPMR